MFEKVNPKHPDKIADRIAGAIVDLAYKKNEKVFVRSGAGIVADSVPEKEYQECINKAKAVMNALEKAGELEE